MPKGFQEDTRKWIESHYGPITIRTVTLVLVTVPVMNGIANGEGLSEEAAIESLYKDLTNQ